MKPIIGQRSQYIDSILLSIIKSVIIFNSIYNPNRTICRNAVINYDNINLKL
jgi:hypothetical protein